MKRNTPCLLLLAACLITSPGIGASGPGLASPSTFALKLPPLFSDHMVLQADMAVPIHGTAAPGEKVTVRFRGQEKSAAADSDGRFRVTLDALKPGGPDTLEVASSTTITIQDVLVGDVWVGSGQSNMAGKAGGYAKNDQPLARMVEQSIPTLRLFNDGKWAAAEPKANAGFSALMLAFGVHLQSELKQPVGLMVGAVGGTPSGFWLTEDMFRANAACQSEVNKARDSLDEAKLTQARQEFEKALATWEKQNAENLAAGKKPDGKAPPKPRAPLRPGECRGEMGHLYKRHITPFLGYGIRGVLWDQGESGTAIENVDQATVMGALIGGWRKAWGQGDFPFLYVQKASGGGCAWDPADPVTAKAQSFEPLPANPPALNAGVGREMHIRIAGHPNTAMVTSTDLGPGVHPTQKSGYGIRAARVALGFVHKRPVVYQGPTYAGHMVEQDAVRLRFTHVGKGLAARHADRLQGFMIAGDDKVFHWGEAVIDGETVVVRSPQVPKPASVRYAWSDKQTWANLFNQDGLPAVTFRTDSW